MGESRATRRTRHVGDIVISHIDIASAPDQEPAMPNTPSDPAPSFRPDAPKDPVDLLVKALAAVPEADRDLVYAWLLRRGSEPGQVTGLAPQRVARRVPVETLLRQNVTLDPGIETGVTIVSGTSPPQASAQQMVPVRFSSEQHAQLRQWCSEHGFSMATVIRGLVSRFLEGQLPGPAQPA
jgi:hypothetical protein